MFMCCIIMDLKAVLVVVGLFTLFLTSTEAIIPKCCITTAKSVSIKSLLNVEQWYVQQKNGACHISALILYMKMRAEPICAPVRLKPVLERIQKIKRHRMRRAH